MASNLITGSDMKASALAATLTAASAFTQTLVSDYFNKDNVALRKRRDSVIRLKSRLE